MQEEKIQAAARIHFEVNRQCPSCSTQFRYASIFGTHKCNASVEGRKEIKQAYDEMLKEVKRRLGFSRAEKECDVEVPGLLLSDPGSERVNHNQNSIPISMGQGVASSQLALEPASATHFEEFTDHGLPQPGNAQLYDLFGDVLHSSHDDQLSGYQSLWDELDPTTSLLLANMDPVVPGLGP
ncbi:egg shell protein [Metarhizium robertsii ARSEF 23]|uniref:Egg shell protein n=1 Tax=Metarhizium robertsii (strain ARSEF 23 / ATCC MYA-3075) TaxID=655844 RepID=A0A0B2XIK0_METRA|nr:egg shell protein [Metarhizium robertsii ARSEF 23]KHO11342.1 egg shell protein [Metarhizium robertsii ARSEF 23]